MLLFLPKSHYRHYCTQDSDILCAYLLSKRTDMVTSRWFSAGTNQTEIKKAKFRLRKAQTVDEQFAHLVLFTPDTKSTINLKRADRKFSEPELPGLVKIPLPEMEELNEK